MRHCTYVLRAWCGFGVAFQYGQTNQLYILVLFQKSHGRRRFTWRNRRFGVIVTDHACRRVQNDTSRNKIQPDVWSNVKNVCVFKMQYLTNEKYKKDLGNKIKGTERISVD